MKKYNIFLWLIIGIVPVINACREDLRDIKREVNNSNGLDLNFSFVNKPDPGTQLVANLYYAQEENEPFYERNPDKVVKHTLSAQDIEKGLTLTFEGQITSPFAYVIAYADVDASGDLSDGDIAVAYLSQSVREVLKGLELAENVSHRKFCTMTMDRVYSSKRPSLEVNLTFPSPPLPGAELELVLYYAESENEPVTGREPDILRKHTLTQTDIANGLKFIFEEIEDVPYLFARAYVDIDNDGSLSYGDIAMYYGDISINDVQKGRALPGDIGARSSVTMAMSLWHADEDAPLTDIDGNVYRTVVIGDLEWMAENLKVTRYRNGAPIPTGFSNIEWIGLTSGAYAVYPYDKTIAPFAVSSEAEVIARYGMLYNGYTVLEPQGLAPAGWRIPTDEDYKALERLLGMPEADLDKEGEDNARGADADVAAKLRSTAWTAAPAGTDDYGFGALPVGMRLPSGTGDFDRFGTWRGHYLWTSTRNAGANFMIARSIRLKPVNRYRPSLKTGISVRCVRDKQ